MQNWNFVFFVRKITRLIFPLLPCMKVQTPFGNLEEYTYSQYFWSEIQTFQFA